MFKINFRITDNFNDLNDLSNQEIDSINIGGYFELQINDKNYGYYKSGPLEKDEEGLDLITTWIEQLLNVLLIFKNCGKYVLLNDIESYNTWIEFKILDGQRISISVIESEKKDGVRELETSTLKDFIYSDWKDEIVTYDEFYKEIIVSTERFINEVKQINKNLIEGKRFKELIELLHNVSK